MAFLPTGESGFLLGASEGERVQERFLGNIVMDPQQFQKNHIIDGDMGGKMSSAKMRVIRPP
jgi:hypothetical protein